MQLVAISPKAASFLRSTAERARVSFAERARVFVHENRSFFFHFFLFFLFFFRPKIEELHFSGNRNGIYVRGDDTRIVESKSEFTRFRRLVENSSPRTVPFRLAPTFELLTRRWPMFTANHDDTLSLSLSLSTDPLFFRRGDTWQASRSKRAHAHTTMFRFSFPSPPLPLNFTPVSNRMTRMRIDSTETIAFRIHSKKGWSVMGYNTWASVYLLT